MDIKNLNNPELRPGDTARSGSNAVNGVAGGKGDANAAPAQGRGDADAVTLSPAARDLAAAGTEAPFDRARVDAIKDAIARGEYAIDPDRIAQAIVAMDDF